MEEYLRSLQQELKGFPAEQQAALVEEIRSHIESGEADPQQGRDRLMKEMGSPEDMGGGFRVVYRPNRLIDYLLVAIPYALYPLLYLQLRQEYSRLDIRLYILLQLPLVVIGFWRRSPLLTLFWMSMIIPQLLYIVAQGLWQSYWNFGSQTILWALLLLVLLALFGAVVWKNRRDLIVLVFGLLPLTVAVTGTALWSIHPVSYTSYNALDRSLLAAFLEIRGRGIPFYATFVVMALVFLPMNRDVRWVGLVIWALLLGLGREYLLAYETGNLAMLAHWVYYLYVLLPTVIALLGLWLDRVKEQPMQLAAQDS